MQTIWEQHEHVLIISAWAQALPRLQRLEFSASGSVEVDASLHPLTALRNLKLQGLVGGGALRRQVWLPAGLGEFELADYPSETLPEQVSLGRWDGLASVWTASALAIEWPFFPAYESPSTPACITAQLTGLSALHTLVLSVSCGSDAFSALESLPRLRRLRCRNCLHSPACLSRMTGLVGGWSGCAVSWQRAQLT